MKETTLKQTIFIFFIAIIVGGLFMGYSRSLSSVTVRQSLISLNDSIVPGLGGLWEGKLQHTMIQRTDTSQLIFDIRESASSYTGVWKSDGIENGLSELSGFFFDGNNFHFHETHGRYVFGIINNNRMTGHVSWSDTGKVWANIELLKK